VSGVAIVTGELVYEPLPASFAGKFPGKFAGKTSSCTWYFCSLRRPRCGRSFSTRPMCQRIHDERSLFDKTQLVIFEVYSNHSLQILCTGRDGRQALKR
jgi:hypothetical protein